MSKGNRVDRSSPSVSSTVGAESPTSRQALIDYWIVGGSPRTQERDIISFTNHSSGCWSFSHHGPSICWALGSPPSHGLILAYRTYILWSLSSFHLPSLNEGFSSTIISYLMVMVVSPLLLRDGSTSGRSGETRWPKGSGANWERYEWHEISITELFYYY